MREYHVLRVNLTPAQVDQLESNHKDLKKHLLVDLHSKSKLIKC